MTKSYHRKCMIKCILSYSDADLVIFNDSPSYMSSLLLAHVMSISFSHP